MSFEALGKSILFHTKNHLAIKGNSQTRGEIISAFADDMRDFLSKSKSRGLLPEDIVEFYKKHFPKINIEVNKMSTLEKKFNPNIAGVFWATMKKNNAEIDKFVLTLENTGFLTKLKNMFRIPIKTTFKVNSEFVDTLIHESTHLMQTFSQKDNAGYFATLKKYSNNPQKTYQDVKNIFSYHIYINSGKDFILPVFANKLYSALEKTTDYNPKLILSSLKYLIRRTQEEKQAFEQGLIHSNFFRNPYLSKSKFYREFVINDVINFIESRYRFNAKIQAMKEEFFELAKKIKKDNN